MNRLFPQVKPLPWSPTGGPHGEEPAAEEEKPAEEPADADKPAEEPASEAPPGEEPKEPEAGLETAPDASLPPIQE